MAVEEDRREEEAFVVQDRRVRYDDPAEGAPPADDSACKTASSPASSTDEASVHSEMKASRTSRELTFQSFMYSLASSALMLLGGEGQEGSEPKPPNLQQAREVIDILTLLQEKTKGNLTAEEDVLLKDMLYTLRITYVERATPKT